MHSIAMFQVAPLGNMVSLTLRGVRVFTARPPSLPTLCLEVRDHFANGSEWLLCRDAEDEPAPVTLTSYLNSLSVTQSGGDVLNASVTLLPGK
jgi:hypothetical protein